MVYPVNKLIHFNPRGCVYSCSIFTFEVFIECLYHSFKIILTMKQKKQKQKTKLYCSKGRIAPCLTSIQLLTIVDDLVRMSQYHVHIILIRALHLAHKILYEPMVYMLFNFYCASFQ